MVRSVTTTAAVAGRLAWGSSPLPPIQLFPSFFFLRSAAMHVELKVAELRLAPASQTFECQRGCLFLKEV